MRIFCCVWKRNDAGYWDVDKHSARCQKNQSSCNRWQDQKEHDSLTSLCCAVPRGCWRWLSLLERKRTTGKLHLFVPSQRLDLCFSMWQFCVTTPNIQEEVLSNHHKKRIEKCNPVVCHCAPILFLLRGNLNVLGNMCFWYWELSLISGDLVGLYSLMTRLAVCTRPLIVCLLIVLVEARR